MRFDERAPARMASITDVARAAEVSSSTVSYVLSGKRPISKETAERVRRAIQELEYRPHAGARALARARTNVIALVIPLRAGQNVPVVMEFVAAVVTQARSFDHDVLLLTQDEGVAGLHRVATSALADALIVMDVQADDPRIAVLRRIDQPAVLLGLPDRPTGLSCVDLDFAAAGAQAVDHLADLGHREIVLVGQPKAVYERNTSYALRLLAGFREAANRRKVATEVASCEASSEGLRVCLAETLAKQPGTTALVVHNEGVRLAVVAALKEHGRQVPKQMSVVAICPDDMADTDAVAFTNIAIPAYELGSIAVDMVMRRLESVAPTETRLLSPVLTVRGSTTGPASKKSSRR
jgi:DNA-binding LacI/PurR family transcriptional regulator